MCCVRITKKMTAWVWVPWVFSNSVCFLTAGVSSSQITVLGSSMVKGRFFKLVVYANTFKSLTGSAEYLFVGSCFPSGGSCALTPTSGRSAHCYWVHFNTVFIASMLDIFSTQPAYHHSLLNYHTPIGSLRSANTNLVSVLCVRSSHYLCLP